MGESNFEATSLNNSSTVTARATVTISNAAISSGRARTATLATTTHTTSVKATVGASTSSILYFVVINNQLITFALLLETVCCSINVFLFAMNKRPTSPTNPAVLET